MAVGLCRVCGHTETINTEDVLPQWHRRHATSVAPGSPFTGTLASGAPFNAPVPFQITVNVGQACNSWMGATFEKPAKRAMLPLIDGLAHTIDVAEQEIIARWVAKTALMNALAHPPSPDERVYREFRRCGDPPPGSRVLLGCYSSRGVIPRTARTAFRKPDPGSRPAGRVSFLPFTATIGQLVVVYCLSIQGPPVRTEAEAQDALVNIWPASGAPITWPPPIELDASSVGAASVWELV